MNLGTNEIKYIYAGSTPVAQMYLGTTKVWPEEPVPVGDWLCFTAEQNGSTLRLDKSGSPGTIYLETSDDGGASWKDYTWSGNTGTEFGNLNAGDKVYFRAKTENRTIANYSTNYYKFVMTGKIAASGNIQTLLKADGSRTDVPAYCYNLMFSDCTSLTTAPALPATTLNRECYFAMFKNCTSLTTAPALPATTLVRYCYQSMFDGCSQLNSIEVAFTAWNSSLESTTFWLNKVAATGTFTCPAELPDTRGTSNIPTGWTKVDAS